MKTMMNSFLDVIHDPKMETGSTEFLEFVKDFTTYFHFGHLKLPDTIFVSTSRDKQHSEYKVFDILQFAFKALLLASLRT